MQVGAETGGRKGGKGSWQWEQGAKCFYNNRLLEKMEQAEGERGASTRSHTEGKKDGGREKDEEEEGGTWSEYRPWCDKRVQSNFTAAGVQLATFKLPSKTQSTAANKFN